MKPSEHPERNGSPCRITARHLVTHLGLGEILEEEDARWDVGVGLHLSQYDSQEEDGESLRLDHLVEEGLFVAGCVVDRRMRTGSWGVDIGQERVVSPNLALIDPE